MKAGALRHLPLRRTCLKTEDRVNETLHVFLSRARARDLYRGARACGGLPWIILAMTGARVIKGLELQNAQLQNAQQDLDIPATYQAL